jgi:hypothetical protein
MITDEEMIKLLKGVVEGNSISKLQSLSTDVLIPLTIARFIMVGDESKDQANKHFMDVLMTDYPTTYNKPYMGWLRAFHNANRMLLYKDWNSGMEWFRDLLKYDVCE